MTAKAKSIGIAGAGLMGRLIALTLLQAGHTVTLFDKDTKDGQASCASAAAGMLSPYAELEVAEPLIVKLGRQATQQWKTILKQLKRPVTLHESGSLLLAHPQDHNELQRLEQTLTHKLAQIPTLSKNAASFCKRLTTAAAIQAIEPELPTHFNQALHFPGEAHLDPQELLPALEHTLLAFSDFTWHEQHAITKVEPYTLYTEGAQFTFDEVIDCRGLGAKDDFPDLRGVRGELIRVYAPEVKLNHIVRLIHPRHPIYIAPKKNNEFIIGASVIESEDKSPISVQTTLELLSAAYSIHSGFAEARILRTAVNCRPAFPDNLPRLCSQPGLTAINGLYRHGYLLAPTMAHCVMNRCHIE